MFNSNNTIIGILAGLLLWLSTAVMAAPVNDSFDHFTTGFSLTGGHRAVECDACHNAGQFRGTQRGCASCHNTLMNTGAVVKSAAHIQTSNDCETCHSTLAWDDVRRVNHMAVLGNCKSCHYLGSASGGPPNDPSHAFNNQDCITCHRTSTWASVHFSHGAGGVCTDCHSATHPGGIAARVAPGGGLHNSVQSAGIQCNKCHNTHSWGFSHSGRNQCDTCHDSPTYTNIVRQKPTGDFHDSTTYKCSSCHSTSAWTPASFKHSGPYPNHTFTNLRCSKCHSGTPQSAANAYDDPGYAPYCMACHYNDFRKEHSASKASQSKYWNCQTGCHEHSNALRSGDWD